MTDAIVVGLGAMGSACAWQLAARGLGVVGLDMLRPPHSLGSSHGGSRVIRETAFEHPRYVPLVRRAYELWAELEARHAAAPLLIPSGALYAGVPSASVVAGSRRSAVEHEVPCEELTAAEIRARWPVFNPAEGMVGLLEHRGGVLRPEACVGAMLAAAAEAGAALRYGDPVLDWGADAGGAWVRTAGGRLDADHLVLAMGPWLLDLLGTVTSGAWVERVVQHWFAPAREADALRPERMPIYLWEDADQVIFYGFPMLDGALKCAVHHRGDSTTADEVRREVSAADVERARSLLARFVPPAAGPRLISRVCLYTNTAGGDFIIDRHPEHERVVIASPCSGIGFKFAPVLGEIVGDLVQARAPGFDLAPFSLNRLLPLT